MTLRYYLNRLQFNYDGYYIIPKKWCFPIWIIEYKILTKLYLWLEKYHPYEYFPTHKNLWNFIFWKCFTNNVPTGIIIISEQCDGEKRWEK